MGFNCKSVNSTSTIDSIKRVKRKAYQIFRKSGSKGYSSLDLNHDMYHKVFQIANEILFSLDVCLGNLENKVKILNVAVDLLLQTNGSCSDNGRNYRRRKKRNKSKLQRNVNQFLEKLLEFKSAEDPFADFDFDGLELSCRELQAIVPGLMQMQAEARERLSSAKRWRKVFNQLCSVVFDLLLLVSVLLASLQSNMTAVAAPVAGAIVMKSSESWVSSLWDKHEEELAEQSEAAETMCTVGTEVSKIESDLVIVRKLKDDLDLLSSDVDFMLAGNKEEAARISENMSRTRELEKVIKDLKQKVKCCQMKLKVASSLGFFNFKSIPEMI